MVHPGMMSVKRRVGEMENRMRKLISVQKELANSLAEIFEKIRVYAIQKHRFLHNHP